MDKLGNRASAAVRWSVVTEASVKLAAPLSSMLLARLLSPEAFGVAAVAVVVLSFAEILSDSGFHKFIIQRSFRSETVLSAYASTAHTANLAIAFLLSLALIVFSSPLAAITGIAGHPDALMIAATAIPFIALGSVPSALMKRDLDFKSLFRVRVISVAVPFAVTVPFALILRSYHAIILGTAVSCAFTGAGAFLLRHDFIGRGFSRRRLGKMARFSLWSLAESLSVWLTTYIDIFIVSLALGKHELGVYRTATLTSGQILGLITASVTPVLFSSLSRTGSRQEFHNLFSRFQKSAALAVAPAGILLFIFADEITFLLLGPGWADAALLIGLWSLASVPAILISHFCSEAYRAMGKPGFSVLSQMLHLAAVVPVICLFTADFNTLCVARAAVRLQGVAVNVILIYLVCGISFSGMIANIGRPVIAALSMTAVLLLPADGFLLTWIIRPLGAMAIYFLFTLPVAGNRRAIGRFFKPQPR